MATNIVTSFSLLVFLLSTACCLAAPMCSHNVEDEPAGAIRHLMAGLRVVDTIAVSPVGVKIHAPMQVGQAIIF